MKPFFASVILLVSVSASATTFEEIWSSFYRNSLNQKAVAEEKEVTELSLERSERHWLPRVYATGQWFRTNDPGQVFFNQLGQRSISTTDFSPSTLNRPDRQTFQMGTIGIDLPLYEGGMKSSQVSHFQKMVKAAVLEQKAKASEEYTELARRYGSVLLLGKRTRQLQELRKGLESVISRYQVGEESNPVGHSGLLGLKGVLNRIDGTLTEYELKSVQEKKWISEKAKLPEDWAPDKSSLDEFLISALAPNATTAYSTMILTQEKKLEAMAEMQRMERARYLPKVGLFAQNNIYHGDRDTASSQSMGLYLMWELFNPDSYGRAGETRAQVTAMETKLRAHKQDEKLAVTQLTDSQIALEKTLNILRNSEELLSKQATLSMRLFRSGMLNALQLAEVVNRRVDLVENTYKAEANYLDVKGRLYQIQH